MSLTGEIINKGITLKEISDLIEKNNPKITLQVLIKELEKEKQRLLAYIGENERVRKEKKKKRNEKT